MAGVPIHLVLEDGRVRPIGAWVGALRRLELTSPGFPLLGPGRHAVEGMLPWVFWDMCPSGFLGRRFARLEQGLRLGSDPRTWSEHEVMRALTEAGEDLPGNLIIGDRSLERWMEHRRREEAYVVQAHAFHAGKIDQAPGLLRRADGSVSEGPRPWDPPATIDDWLDAEAGEPVAGSSSLGGERPKLSIPTPSGASLLKFSPPVGPPATPAWTARLREYSAVPGFRLPDSTPQSQRWADLLRVEAHCAATLRHFGVAAVEASAAYSLTGRVVLEVVRFDRTTNWGRRGATTLYWYAMARHGDVSLPAPEVVRGLVEDGHLAAGALETVERVHAFSAAIGNTDAHLGNYGLVFDEGGRATLAPFFDILPMALAPVHDELPDERLRRKLVVRPKDSLVAAWLDELERRVSADEEISSGFREVWFRLLGIEPG